MNPKIPFRCLRGYAFDPSMSLDIDVAEINEITYKIPWEDKLLKGPEGEYIKVIDRDPSSDAVYLPVNLNDPEILANDGLDPTIGNPQFHQQMVYAVAMNTIVNFEKAIGRKVQWSPVAVNIKVNGKLIRVHQFVRKLLIYPHALRDANAYYSSDRKALLFGYFNSTPLSADLQMPGSVVFSCLSHDIIAHETAHAILDGIFPQYMEQTHPDVGAFHEAFGDLVALFQHFTFPEVLENQIAKTRGRFDAENLLGKLAVEFGIASGSYGSLRDSIGTMDGKKWTRATPNLDDYLQKFEPHDRGSILVAAVFDAFITIYNKRSEDLIRIATNGSGLLPEGRLGTDLIKRLAREASKAASHVLTMCIRALDYCPPIDINFGDYLRAIITADVELVPDDPRSYRIAFIEAFRKRGIYPEGLMNLSVETLTYTAEELPEDFKEFTETLREFLIEFKNHIAYETSRRKIFNITKRFISSTQWKGYVEGTEEIRTGLHDLIYREVIKKKKRSESFEKLTGLVFSGAFGKLDIERSRFNTGPGIEIHDVRINNRISPNGTIQNQAIIIFGQRCGVRVKYDEKKDDYEISTYPKSQHNEEEEGAFVFRGGATLVFDLNTCELKHVISKPILDPAEPGGTNFDYKPNRSRAIMQYRSLYGDYSELSGFDKTKNSVEPFAHIHHKKNIANESES